MADSPKKLKDLKVADLKVELDKRGLQTSGVKAVLIERLKAALQEEGQNGEEIDLNNEEKTEESENQDEAAETSKTEEQQQESEEVSGEAVSENPTTDAPEAVEEMEGDKEDVIMTNGSDKENNLEEEKVLDEVHETVENGKSEVNEANEDNEDSLNIMIGDEDNLFEDENENKDNGLNGVVRHASPPRPDSIPAKHPFTSKDTISLSSRGGKAPSDNSSMLVNPDECSVASHDSAEAKETEEKNGNAGTENKDQNGEDGKKTKEETDEEKKKSVSTSSRNLWISGLSSTTRATDLKSVFSKHGKVVGAKVVTNARTPGARCYGYVTMNSSEDAAKCIQNLNKTELHGRMITVERAKEQSSSSKTSDKSDDKKKEHDNKDEKKDDGKDEKKDDSKKSGTSSSSRNRITAPEGSSSSSSRRDDDRRTSGSRTSSSHHSHSSSRRDDRRSHGQVLTFNQIRDQRKRELEKEEQRRKRRQEEE